MGAGNDLPAKQSRCFLTTDGESTCQSTTFFSRQGRLLGNTNGLIQQVSEFIQLFHRNHDRRKPKTIALNQTQKAAQRIFLGRREMGENRAIDYRLAPRNAGLCL